MTDIATLGIAINTNDVTSATRDLNLLITVANRTDGAIDELGDSVDSTGSSLNSTSTATNALRNATAALISALSINQVIGYADAWTSAQNSIRQVTISTSELDDVTKKLRKSAQDSRSNFSATTDLYAKLKRSSEDLGLSQQQLIDVTTTINKSFSASGATAIEAENAIRQLSQGLASGVLRGDEFNSVAEQAPGILRAISKSTGTATGELRKLAAQGAITAEVVVKSLQLQAETIDEEFARSVETFGQKMGTANDNVTEFLGTSANVQSSVQAIGDAMVSLSANLESISKAAQTLALVGGAVVVVVGLTKAVNLATTAVIALNAATALNPWVTLARVVGVAAIAIGSYIGLTEEATEAINKNTKAVDDNTLSFKENGEIVGEINKKSIEASISSLKTEIAILETKNAVIRTNINQLSSLADQYKETASVVAGYNQAIINATVTLDGNINTIRTAEKNLESLENRFKTWGTTVENAPPKLIALGSSIKKLTGAQKDLKAAMKEGIGIFNDTRTPLEQYNTALARANELLKLNAIDTDTFSRHVASLKGELYDATEGLDELGEEGETAFDKMLSAGDNALTSLEDSLVNFVTTGKLSFSGMVDSILNDIARIAIQQSITGPLSGAISGIFGSIGSSLFATPPVTAGGFGGSFDGGGFGNLFAKGGVPDSPRMFASGGVPALSEFTNSVISSPTQFTAGGTSNNFGGEAGPEAIMPLTRMSGGNLGVEVSGANNTGGGSVVVQNNLSIINSAGSEVSAEETGRSTNSSGGIDIELTITKAVNQGLQKGVYDRTFRNRFNLNPKGV
jgi:lambda family phage tail tape measure protein